MSLKMHLKKNILRIIHRKVDSSGLSGEGLGNNWLCIPERIQYKCCLLVYKSLHGLAPSYISNFCIRVQLSDPRLSLCSAARSHYKLVVPRSSKFAERSFTLSGPSVWNSLPDHVVSAPSLDTFKDRLSLSYPLST